MRSRLHFFLRPFFGARFSALLLASGIFLLTANYAEAIFDVDNSPTTSTYTASDTGKVIVFTEGSASPFGGNRTVGEVQRVSGLRENSYTYKIFDTNGKLVATYGQENDGGTGSILVYEADGVTKDADAMTSAGGQSLASSAAGSLAKTAAAAAGIPTDFSQIVDWIIKGIGKLFEVVGYYVWMFASAVLWVAGQALNFATKALVNDMGAYSELWAAVREGWAAIRDVGNTLFIFVLLYAAFNTVLGLKNGLELVPRVIIVALLVNFSYRFAVSVIDASNTLASKVYKELAGENAASGGVEIGFSGQLAELAGARDFALAKTSAITSSGATGGSDNSASALGGFSYFIRAVFQSGFMLVLSGFMLAIVFTLIARFVTLVVLCVVAALAFLSYLLPKFEKHSHDWWAALIGQSFYAPAVFLMLLITTGIAEKVGESSLIKKATGTGANAASNFENILSFGLGEFFNFCILIGLLYASMAIAKKISEQGSTAAISIGQRAQKAAAAAAFGGAGWAGRGILGRAGSGLANSDTVKNLSVQGGIRGAIGRRLMGVGGRMQDSSFDFRKTGAAAALSAATGADYGKVSDLASKGRRGYVEDRDKRNAEKIEAVQKSLDMSKDDKLEKINELTGNSLQKADKEVADAKKAVELAQGNLDAAKASGASSSVIIKLTNSLSAAKMQQGISEDRKKDAEENGYKILNRKIFGVETKAGEKADRDMNASIKYAQSRSEDARARSSGRRTLGWVAGAVGASALAPLAPAAMAAIGVISAGKAVHSTITHIRGINNAQIKASKKHEDAYKKVIEARSVVAALDSEEKQRSAAFQAANPANRAGMLQGLTRAEETERRKAQAKVDKAENAGKKRDD